MSKIKVGSALSLKIKYNNNELAEFEHYYLVAEEIEGKKYKLFGIVQFDSIKDKNIKSRFDDSIFYIPIQSGTFIKKESYVDLKKEIRIEKYDELDKYLVENNLSEELINDIISNYKEYHNTNIITNDNKVSILKDELELINK